MRSATGDSSIRPGLPARRPNSSEACECPALPALFGLPDGIIHTQDDLKKLPVAAFVIGIGDRAQPSYHLDDARVNDRFHFYVQDSWKVTPTFTLNYGLGWEHETNVLNYDLRSRQYLAPIYGKRPEPDEEGVQELCARWRALPGRSARDTNRRPRRRGNLLRHATRLVAAWRRAVIGGSGPAIHRQRCRDQPAHRPAVQHAVPQLARLQLRHVPGAAAGAAGPAGRQIPGDGTPPQILLSKQANALGALYPHDFPTTQGQALQRRFPA